MLIKKTILTNSPSIATILIDMHQKQGHAKLSNVYFVTEDKGWATGLYTNFDGNRDFTPVENTYVAPINEFVKEFRRKFDYILLDFDGLSSKDLNIACEVITHGAKDNCIVCITSSCEGIDEIAIEKINTNIEAISKVFCSDLPETQRLYIYMNQVAIAQAATPWI